MTAERMVDARGLRCPWPVIRLARAARELGGPGRIRIIADDPIAPSEIAALCADRGWQVSPDPQQAHGFEVVINSAS